MVPEVGKKKGACGRTVTGGEADARTGTEKKSMRQNCHRGRGLVAQLGKGVRVRQTQLHSESLARTDPANRKSDFLVGSAS